MVQEKVGEREARPVPRAILDPSQPGVPPTDRYLEFPTYLYIPRAGCYQFDVAWPGGSWRLVIGLGAEPGTIGGLPSSARA